MGIPISSKLEWVTPGELLRFWCPACQTHHIIRVPAWSWNGDGERPTFSPSILVSWPANPDAGEGFEEWRTERRCHSFVTDGRIQFLADCTHALAGQTADLPDLP